MEMLLNDLPFRYEMSNEHEIKRSVDKFVSIFIELKGIRKNMKLVYFNNNITSVELMPGYNFSKLFNDKSIPLDKRRIILNLFTKLKIVEMENFGVFNFDGNKSKLCSYALSNEILVISFITNKIFEMHKLEGQIEGCDYIKEVKNIGNKEHLVFYTNEIGIRIYEMNPKHKIGSNWGSPMDLDDNTAQQVLDSAIIYNDDDKCLVNLYNDKYYVFRRHINNCYHGYIDEGVPENIRKKLIDRIK